MTLGRTAGKIKIKTDDGLRAVSCGCCCGGFKAFQPEEDGSWKTYKYLKVNINTTNYGEISGCDMPLINIQSNNLWYEIEKISQAGQCVSHCLNAQGSSSVDYRWDGMPIAVWSDTIAQCIVTRVTETWDGEFITETFDFDYRSYGGKETPDEVGPIRMNYLMDCLDPTPIYPTKNIVSDTYATVSVAYGQTITVCSGSCETTDCSCDEYRSLNGSANYIFQLSNEPFN